MILTGLAWNEALPFGNYLAWELLWMSLVFLRYPELLFLIESEGDEQITFQMYRDNAFFNFYLGLL